MQSPQPYDIQPQAVPLLEQEATATGPPRQPVPPPSRHVHDVTPFPPLQRQRHYHLDMVAGIALPPAKFHVAMKNL